MNDLDCTPVWLVGRIAAFLSRLDDIESSGVSDFEGYKESVRSVCATEMAYLRDVLGVARLEDTDGVGQDVVGPLNTLVTYLTDYRSGVKSWFKERLDERNSVTKEVGGVGEVAVERLHVSLLFLVPSNLEKKVRKHLDRSSKIARVKDRLPINPHPIYVRSLELLGARSYADRALSLAAMTGRRMIEILKTGEFKESGDPNSVLFRGQAKTKSETRPAEWYEVPTLIPPRDAIATLESIRESRPNFQGMSNKRVNRTTSQLISQRFSRHFRKILPEGSEPKSLRAAYAVTCWEKYGKLVCRDEAVYFAKVLGHDSDDIETSAYYRRFYVEQG